MDDDMAIDPLPTPPSRADAVNFAQRGDTFMAAFPPLVDQINAATLDITEKQGIASTAASTAVTKAGEASDDAAAALASKSAAATSEGNAEDSAAAALASKNAAATSESNAATSETNAANSAASVDAQGFATDYAGATEPAVKWPYMTWADTGNDLLKRRNAADDDWITIDYLAMSLSYRQWAYLPMGTMYFSHSTEPPTDSPHFRFIKLSAGSAYNSGVLINEAVSGSAPNMDATGEVNVPGSPYNGTAIRLLNTEGRYLRPGTAYGLQESQNASHNHSVSDPGHGHSVSDPGHTHPMPFQTGGPIVGGQAYQGAANIGNQAVTSLGPTNISILNRATGVSINLSGGNETRPRSVVYSLYLKVL